MVKFRYVPKKISNYVVKYYSVKIYFFIKDIQELSITLAARNKSTDVSLINNYYKPSCVNTMASKTFVDQQKWDLFKLVKVSQTASYDRVSVSSAFVIQYNRLTTPEPPKLKSSVFCVSCFCVRKPSYYYLNAYFLILLITSSSLTIFSVDHTLPQNRLQTLFTILLTSVSFKWVINRSLPDVSYSTSLDKYSLACIFFLCTECVWHALVGSVFVNHGLELDMYALFSFSIFLLIINLVFILILLSYYGAIRNLRKEEQSFLERINAEFPVSENTERSFTGN